jgi:hypothetical protein
MTRRRSKLAILALASGFLAFGQVLSYAAGAKPHIVALGAARKVPYSANGDPAGARKDETELHVRPLVVDGKVKEWTTGDAHDITDRSFVVRRAIRLNDALPTDTSGHNAAGRWVWQRGPWLLVDRTTGHITALRLPDYDPAVSDVSWFRDYAAYCGLNSGGHQLYAVVAQIAARKPVLSKKLGEWNPADHPSPACVPASWQREPLRIGFQPTGGQPVSFDLIGLSAVLVEDGDAGDAAN